MQPGESGSRAITALAHAAAPDISQAFQTTLNAIGLDGCVAPHAARVFREALMALDADTRRTLATDPALLLPAFDDVPVAARNAVRDAIVSADHFRMRGYTLGGVHDALIRSAWKLRLATRSLKKSRNTLARTIHRGADTLAFAARSAPAWALDRATRTLQLHRARNASRPELLALLHLAGIDPRYLVVGWANRVPQPETFRGYWHDASRQRTVGLVVGFDLLPTNDGFWFVESNVSIAQRSERATLYERDPFVLNLLTHAREHGYTRVVVLDNNADGLDPRSREQYENIARELGLALSLVSRRSLPRSAAPDPRSFGVPPISDRTLVVRVKAFHTTLDHLLNNKRMSIRVLEQYQTAHADPELRIPRTGAEPPAIDYDPASRFPNIVYKLPQLDAAKGLAFLKARNAADAAALVESWKRERAIGIERLKYDDSSGLYQTYIAPRLLDGRHAYIVRAHVLITPVGHRYLSAHRVVSARTIPERLEPGIVRDAAPYLVNFSSGAAYGVVPPDEESQVQAAALAASRGLAWAVERAFETRAQS
jgi:hypothetical protein